MSEPLPNNPAARLHFILGRAKPMADSTLALAQWARLFGVATDAPGKAEVLRRGGELMKMALEVRMRVLALPHAVPDAFMDHFGGVESCLDRFTVVAQIPMQEFMAHYNQNAEQALVLCDYALSRDDPDRMPSSEQLNGLLEGLAALREDVVRSEELDEFERSRILEHLDKIDKLLREIPERGVAPARDGMNVFIGQLVVNMGAEPSKHTAITKAVGTFLIGAALMLTHSASDSIVNQYLSSPGPHSAIEGVFNAITEP